MANVTRIAGLSPVQYLNGAPWNGQARLYYIDSTDTNAFAVGDPVVLSGSADTNGVPSITLASAGSSNTVTGALVGMGDYEGTIAKVSNPNSIILPATKTISYYAMVADDPNIIFQIQEGGTATALTAAAVGTNASLLTGTNNAYVSGWTFDNNTVATTVALQLKLLGLVRKSDNAFGQYAKWLVKINNHTYAAATTGY